MVEAMFERNLEANIFKSKVPFQANKINEVAESIPAEEIFQEQTVDMAKKD